MKIPTFAHRISRSAITLVSLASAVACFIAAFPSVGHAQRWKEIGKTKANAVVLIDTKSVKRLNDSVSVTMKTRFAQPDGEGITGTRTIATFNCATERVAIKENDSYKGERVVKKSVPKIPGYGAVFGGSLTGVAYEYLCGKKR